MRGFITRYHTYSNGGIVQLHQVLPTGMIISDIDVLKWASGDGWQCDGTLYYVICDDSFLVFSYFKVRLRAQISYDAHLLRIGGEKNCGSVLGGVMYE